MRKRQSVSLNFFPLDCQEFEFTVYRRRYEEHERSASNPGLSRYRLPDGSLDDHGKLLYFDYWVSFNEQAGLERYTCSQYTNNSLTCSYLFELLKSKCEATLHEPRDYSVSTRKFRSRRIEFTIEITPGVGRQIVWLEPYFLKTRQLYGFLVDFSFNEFKENTDTLAAKKLSLSLNKSGGSNRDYYSDRYDKIREFVRKYQSRVFALTDNMSLATLFSKVDADTLETKRYIFSGGSSKASQFTGIRDIGPLRSAESAHKIYFLFQEADRPFSYDLYRALRGDTFPRRFPGMGKMFDFAFDGTNVGGKSLVNFSYENVATAVSEILEDANGRIPMLLIVSPFDKFSNSRTDRVTYMQIKHHCLSQEIPCQFVSIPLMRKKRQFEWAISSIGLQVFAKMGGWPWQVHHKTSKCLIVGISQAHERVAGEVKKYFAYSTFTDSSGIYKELKILSDTDNHQEYIYNLKRNLADAITYYYADFDTFVIHTTFAIRRSELTAITEVISSLETDQVAQKTFTVIKFNDDTRFFGYSADNNSMVPYESTYIQLSGTEYLIWFEGLQYQSERVPANLERPVHVKFIYPDSAVPNDACKAYLQDALNISGANWRGFNAKSLPVSIFYASLVAQFYRDCKKYGLEAIDLEAITPWFL